MEMLFDPVNKEFPWVFINKQFGLHNISARLRLYAGSSSCLRVQSKPGLGTRVELILPWRGF